MLKSAIRVFLFSSLCYTAQTATAQTSASIHGAFEQAQVSSVVTFAFTKGSNMKQILNSNHQSIGKKILEIEELPLDVNAYANLIRQGAYIAPDGNHLYINTNYDHKYERAELINKKTNDQVFKTNLASQSEFVDIADIESGVYMLILTNDKGDIHVEELNVVTP